MRFRIAVCIVIFLFLSSSWASTPLLAQSFLQRQLTYPRVSLAKSHTDYSLKRAFQQQGLPYPPEEIYIRVFKSEGILEVWVKDKYMSYVKFKDYKICAASGKPGPKRRQGDLQVPEGFYYINKFNPVSSFFLSLGINYPNASDRILGHYNYLGSDIFIHGKCTSAGCVSMTDHRIKELYWLAAQAKNNGQDQIPVHIFPFKYNDYDRSSKIKIKYSYNYKLLHFWDNLQVGYDYFEANHIPPTVYVNPDGTYRYW